MCPRFAKRIHQEPHTMTMEDPRQRNGSQYGRRIRRSRPSTIIGSALAHSDPCKKTPTLKASWSCTAVSCMLVLWFMPSSLSVPFGTCLDTMTQADADGNQQLIQSEYVSFVRALSMNTVTDEFYSYPAELSGAFTQRKSSTDADAGISIVGSDIADSSATDAQVQEVQSFCRDVYKGLAAALSLPLDNTTCIRSFILGDNSRDDSLTEDEYSRFLAALTSNISSSATTDELKTPLPEYFKDFEDDSTGAINVTGSKPGTSSYVDQSQLDYLTDFCTVSVVGTALSLSGSTTPESEAPAPAPVLSPTSSGGTPTAAPASNGSGGFVPTFSFYECTSAMAYSDLSRDAVLDESEYVRFLNRLSSGKYEDSNGDDFNFSALPAALQDNYDALAAGGSGIDVAGGTRPGQEPSDTEKVQLDKVCLATDEALQAADGNNPQPSPATPSAPTTSAPATVPPVTPAPTAAGTSSGLTYPVCVRNIMLSDTSRDNALDETEYVRFLNLGSDRAWNSLTFDELEPILQQNFDSLALNGTVSVVGYNPYVNASAEQLNHLRRVCSQSATAIESALNGGGTWPPTAAPAPPSTETIFNAYLTSNTAGLTAKGLRVGPTRQALDDAYDVFVNEQVQLYLTSLTRRLRLRGTRRSDRWLSQASVSLNSDSILTYQVDDSTCPAGVTGASCQTVYANFSVDVANVPDPKVIVDALTRQTQAAMATDMQRFVTAAVAATPNAVAMQVNGPAAKTTPDEPNPQPAPTAAPQPTPSGGGGSSPGKTAAAIIGFILLIGLCAGGAIYLHKKGYKVSDFLSWLPPIPGFSGSEKAKKEKDSKNVGGTVDGGSRDGSTHLDDEGGLDNNGFGTFETVPTPDKPSFYKNSENGEGSSSVDFMEGEDSESADFSVVEQGTPVGNQQGKSGVFNAFGLGKNKKATGGLDDSYGDLQNPEAINENAAHDFADYGFDDPTADFEQKNGSVGDLFEKDDGFASGAKEMAWGGETNEWDGAWGAGAGVEPSAPATRQSGRSSVSGSERSDDDSRSGSESEESESYFERKTSGDRGPTVEAPDNLVHLDSMVEQGNWDEAMAAKAKFEGGFDLEEGSNPSRPSLEESEGLSLSESRSSADDFAEGVNADSGEAGVGDESVQDSHWSLTSEEVRRRDQFRQQVENLVRKIVPDELDNVSAMMDQFAGREAELINTLQNMKERTTTQRARKAIHKSKGIPQRENPAFAAGGADGSAAIAAASTLGVRKDEFEDDGADDDYVDGADEDGNYYDDDARSYDEDYEEEYPEGDAEEGSQYSGSEGRSYDEGGSQYSGSQDHDDPDREGSYYDDEERSGSFSGSGSRSRSRSGSYSGSGSFDDQEQEASYTDDQGESYDDQEGSYYSGDDQDRSHNGSYSGSGSGSYNDDQDPDGSYTDDQGEGSYRSEDDRSHDGSYSGNGSYEDGDQGSYYSDEGSGSRSHRSQDDEDAVDYGYE